MDKIYNERYKYLIAFLIGIGALLLGAVLYMIPIVAITIRDYGFQDLEVTLMDNIYTYQGQLTLVLEITCITIALVFFRDDIFKDLKKFKDNWIRNIIIIVVAVILAVFALDEIYTFIFEKLNITGDSENQNEIIRTLQGKGRLGMIISAVVVAPIFEELVFRKFAYGYLSRTKLPKWLNIIITAFIFAIIHCTTEDFTTLESWLYLSNYFVLALVIVLSYTLSDENIFVSISVHFLNNLVAMIMILGAMNAIY